MFNSYPVAIPSIPHNCCHWQLGYNSVFISSFPTSSQENEARESRISTTNEPSIHQLALQTSSNENGVLATQTATPRRLLAELQSRKWSSSQQTPTEDAS